LGSGFKGRFTTLMDSKQRVAVPAKLRRNTPSGSADSFVITLGLDNCLFLFPQEQWDEITAKLKNVSFTGRKAKFLTRTIASNAEDVDLDGQSRIRIPGPLVDEIQLEKEVLFVGALTRIEIWRPDTYEKYLQEFDQSYEDVAEDFLL
jgi:MraZ protein